MVDTLFIKSKLRDYSVFFDEFEIALSNISKDKSVIIIDSNFHKMWPIKNYNFDNTLIIDALESSKEFSEMSGYIDVLLEMGIRKNWTIVAIGGGIIQDISGFIASILFRGIDWWFFPTTLLAQADSCIGSKTSINLGNYKNQVGTFYPPNRVIIDTRLLKTLPQKDIYSGFGEIYKYHILDGKYELISTNMEKLVSYCLKVKKEYIEADEFDRGRRNILNYGHTFGHAIESLTDFKESHGKCVAEGMKIANHISYTKGWMSYDKYGELSHFLKDQGFKTKRGPGINTAPVNKHNIKQYIEALKRDKKIISDKLRIIVPTDMRMEIKEVSFDYLKKEVINYKK